MVPKKLRHPLVAYWLLFTLTFGIFAPAVGQGLAAQKNATGLFVAVCTATGIQYIKLDIPSAKDKLPSPNQTLTLHDQACAVCASSLDSGSVTKADQAHQPLPLRLIVSLQRASATPETNNAWSPHSARAPPSV
jgi:hypothetical protein